MKQLFALALKQKNNFSLMLVMCISMVALTIATQMEIITLGVLTQKSPGFFELFGSVENQTLVETGSVSKKELAARFSEITDENGNATHKSVRSFLTTVRPKGIVDRAVQFANMILPIGQNPLYLALLVLIVATFNACAMFWYRFTTKMVAIRVSQDLRQSYFEHIQTLPMSFYQKHSSGSLSARVVSDAVAIADGVNATLTNYLQTPFTITTTLALCFYASWKLTLFVFLGLPLIAYPIVLIAKHIRRLSRALQKNQENFSTILLDYLSGVQTVKIFGIEHFSLKKYREENERMAAIERKSAKYDVSSRPIVHTIGMTFLCTSLIIGLYFFNMSVPEVLVYCGLLYVFYEPVKKFAETNAVIQRGAAAAERMQEVLDVKPEIKDADDAIELSSFEDSIEFKNISFRYNESWVLKDVSIKVKKGQTVALVGPTGSGKSTLANLLPRLYDVQKGSICIDGKPLQAYTQSSIREMMAFVPQKPFIFIDTIKENITFGKEHTEAELESALERSHAKEFVQKLPQGENTLLSEAGKNLSGGQQQRLAIARALMKDAPILVLDEATSALDAVSENHIKEAISNLRGSMTQIIIAHRLSTIEDADCIYFLEEGKIKASGTLQELLISCSDFKLMWEMLHKKTEGVHA